LPKHYAYQLDVDVRINDLQDGSFGNNIYEAEWLSRRREPLVLIEKKEEPSECELLFYTTFNDHKHLVHTLGFVRNDRQSIMILQERAPRGNLQTLLETGQSKPSEEVLIEIFSQILDALIAINGQGLVHGDVRCANVLVFEMHSSKPKQILVKLTNFGLAHRNDPSFVDDRRLVISVRHCATEILRSAGRSNYSEMSDVYSMGVLMWEALSKGKRPYHSSETNSEVRQRKLNGEKLAKPLVCDDQIWSIMKDCWHNETLLRYDLKEMKIRLSSINFE
jgi:serine/threonine protein kinase